MKKILILMLPALFIFFNFNDVHAEPTNVVQTFISNNNMNPTQVNGLTTYDISSGTYFILYDFGFQDSSLQKGKTYHVEMNLFGSLGDGYYSFNSDNFDFYGSTDGVNQQKLTMINFHMDGTGEYRSLVFDFYLHDNFTHFNLKTSDGNGVIYYQYQGSGKFGWYGLKVNKVADSEDVLKDQNEVIIGQNSQIIQGQDKTNDKLNDINSSLTDETPPNLDSLNNSAGWLPAGPVDSILNLPLSLLNNLTTNLSKQCHPVNLPLPYVDKNLPLPCISTIYDQIDGLNTFFNWAGGISTAFILYKYLLSLYKWVDDTLTFRENNYLDNWGGI